MIKVMLVDDEQLILDGLKLIIELEEDMKVVAMANNGQEAIKCVEASKPDIILMDVRMPVMNGVEAVKMIRFVNEAIKIVMVTTFDDGDFILEALANGASGYLLKNMDSQKMVTSIRDAMSGNLLLDGQVAQNLASRAIGQKVANHGSIETEFSKRERDIATLMVRGMSTKEMSDELGLTTGTVKNYITNIYAELGTSNRGKAIVKLTELGF